MRNILTIVFSLLYTVSLTANPAINEVFFNSELQSNACDAIEIAGTPGDDIGCYVVLTSSVRILIPSGAVIPPNGFYLIGSGSCNTFSGIDLDLEMCTSCCDGGACANNSLNMPSTGVGVALFNPSGTPIDTLTFGVLEFINNFGLDGKTLDLPTGTSVCSNSGGTVTTPNTGDFTSYPSLTPSFEISVAREPDITGAFKISTNTVLAEDHTLGFSNVPSVGPGGGGGAAAAPGVPTLSEWGLINFSLLLLIFGVLAIIKIQRKDMSKRFHE